MATHNLEVGTLTIDTFGSFATLRWPDHMMALNPRHVNAGVDGVVMWVEFGSGGTMNRMTFSLTAHALAVAAGPDFLRSCALALRAGDPAGGDIA